MKFNLDHIKGFIIITCFWGFLAFDSYGQENRPFPEPEMQFKDSRMEYSTTELEPISATRPHRDSAQVQLKTIQPAQKPVNKSPEKSTKEKQEDPLSFNFLYYIIEKFKLSDIIE